MNAWGVSFWFFNHIITLKSYTIKMKEPYIISIKKKQTTFWSLKYIIIKKRDREKEIKKKKRKRNVCMLPAWRDLVIHSKIKVEEIWFKDSRKLLCDYCKNNGVLYNVYILIMDDIMPTFFTFLLSIFSSCFYFCTSLRMSALPPMHFSNILNHL